jgi:hypothetical protein
MDLGLSFPTFTMNDDSYLLTSLPFTSSALSLVVQSCSLGCNGRGVKLGRYPTPSSGWPGAVLTCSSLIRHTFLDLLK